MAGRDDARDTPTPTAAEEQRALRVLGQFRARLYVGDVMSQRLDEILAPLIAEALALCREEATRAEQWDWRCWHFAAQVELAALCYESEHREANFDEAVHRKRVKDGVIREAYDNLATLRERVAALEAELRWIDGRLRKAWKSNQDAAMPEAVLDVGEKIRALLSPSAPGGTND